MYKSKVYINQNFNIFFYIFFNFFKNLLIYSKIEDFLMKKNLRFFKLFTFFFKNFIHLFYIEIIKVFIIVL